MGKIFFEKGDPPIMEAITSINTEQSMAPINKAYGKPTEHTNIEIMDQRVEQTTTRNIIENGKVIVVRYDRQGKLISKTPPGYLLPDEII